MPVNPFPTQGDYRARTGNVVNDNNEIFLLEAEVLNDLLPFFPFDLTEVTMVLDPANFSAGAPFHLYPAGDDKKTIVKDDPLSPGETWTQEFTLESDPLAGGVFTSNGTATVNITAKLFGSTITLQPVTVTVTVVKG